jgi:biopolymer transport protein TolQ
MVNNPFFAAYNDSDWVGKIIYIGLILLSVISWSVLIYKAWLIKRVKRESFSFRKVFVEQKQNPLSIHLRERSNPECPNAFYIVYEIIKSKTLELFEKNKRAEEKTSLSSPDIELLGSCAQSSITSLTKYLDKNLYILSTVVTLSPFLGLLGTVYGILVTFSGMNDGAFQASNQAVLGGLSLALTTTVLGLVNAIPAIIGYNYLKNSISEFDSEMGRFATDVLTTVELQFRKVE